MTHFFTELHFYYLSEIKTAKTTAGLVKSSEIIKTKLPTYIQDELSLDPSDYLVKGSVGAGNIATVPWVCVFDREVTTSAQNGFDIVILFRPDMSGLYISLNQGWTQYRDNFKPLKKARDKIVQNAVICRNVLKIDNLDSSPIDLKANGELPRGYELGNIYSKYFDLEVGFTEKEFLQTLNEFVFIYKQLKALIGSNILAITGVIEEDYQDTLQAGELSNKLLLPDGPVALGAKKESAKTNSNRWSRSADIAHEAIVSANNECFFNKNHTTFTSRRSTKPFMEAHHLIAMEYQDRFEFSLDVPENILCICPNCHRQIHHGTEKEVKPLLDLAFQDRNKALRTRGLDISIEELCKLYFKSI